MFTLLLAPLGLGGGRGVLRAVVLLGSLLGRRPRRLRLLLLRLVLDERLGAQRVRELLQFPFLLFFLSQLLLGRIGRGLDARRAFRLEGLGALGLCRSQCRIDSVKVE